MDKKKIYGIAIGAGVIVASVLGGAVGYTMNQPVFVEPVICPEPIVCEEHIACEPEVITETKIEYVNQTVEVQVDNGNLMEVLDEIYDNNGKIQYLIDDLDDDEVDEIVDRIIFVNDIKEKALTYVKDNLFDELDKEVITLKDNSTEKLDDSDMERLRLDEDADEVIIEDIDFEDSDADVKVTFRFEQDNIKFEGSAVLEFKDGEVDDFDTITVSEK